MVTDQVRQPQKMRHGISDLGCTIRVAKKKFSHDVAHIVKLGFILVYIILLIP